MQSYDITSGKASLLFFPYCVEGTLVFLKMSVSHEDQGMGPQTSPRVMLFYALPGYTDHQGPLCWSHLPGEEPNGPMREKKPSLRSDSEWGRSSHSGEPLDPQASAFVQLPIHPLGGDLTCPNLGVSAIKQRMSWCSPQAAVF